MLLVAGSVFFSLSEISLAASRKIKLQVMADEGNRHAEKVLALQAQPGNFFTVVQIGLNTVAILGGILGESALNPAIRELIAGFYQGPWLGQISSAASFVFVRSMEAPMLPAVCTMERLCSAPTVAPASRAACMAESPDSPAPTTTTS